MWDMIVNRAGVYELMRFRRDSALSPGGFKDGLGWVWEGRATTTHASPK